MRFINDFVHPVSLSKILKLDNENKLKSENTNIFIKPSQLDINQKIIYKEQIVDISISDPTQLSFVNIVTGKKIPSRHIYFNEALEYPLLSKEKSFQTLNDNDINYDVNYKNRLITIQSGQYEINVNIITPHGFNLVIQKNTKLLLNKGVSFLVRGGLDINGTMDQPVIIDRKDKNTPFGVFSVAGEKKESVKVNINHLKFSGGSEALVNGIQFSGQMSIINAKVSIKNSIFQGSVSDDGINIKYSKVNISNSKFINNFADQIDLDYCQATIINNIFSSKKLIKLKDLVSTDGLDVSGSKVRVMGNTFSNFSDKGVSIGEISNVLIRDNIFYNNNMAIAVKDGSQSFIGKNRFQNNKVDISMYIKKKMYNKPSLHTIPSNKLLNFKIVKGDVFYSNNLNNIFLREDVE